MKPRYKYSYKFNRWIAQNEASLWYMYDYNQPSYREWYRLIYDH